MLQRGLGVLGEQLTDPNPKWRRIFLVCAGLTMVVVWASVYFGHLFGDVGYPWDFMLGYHASNFYVVESLKSGVFPQWVPFQAMGYPITMNVQSGLFYPGTWLCAALGLSYTLRTAVVIQVLHVLWGMFGMCYLARQRGFSLVVGTVCGVAFLFFGGFYSNAQHLDIVRMYAWTPFLFACMSLKDRRSKVELILIPAIVFCFITGSYPGGMMANLFLVALYWTLQLVARKPWRDRSALTDALRVLLMFGIGVGLAAVFLLPPFLLRHELVRSYVDFSAMSFWNWKHFLTLITNFNLKMLSLDVSMRSVFVGIPVLVGFLLFDLKTLKSQWPLLTIGVLSGFMICGSFVFKWVTAVLPLLSLSRFPASDYRVAIAIPVVIIGVGMLDRITKKDASSNLGQLWKLLIANGVVLAAAYFMHPGFGFRFIAMALSLVATNLVLVLLVVTSPKGKILVFVMTLAVLIPVDALRMLRGDLRTWYYAGLSAHHYGLLKMSKHTFGDDLRVKLRQPDSLRPARDDVIDPLLFSVRGYLTGEYLIHDYSCGQKMLNYVKIIADPELLEFMKQTQKPVLIRPGEDARLALRQIVNSSEARPLLYSPNLVAYKIDLAEPMTLIENECYFPGWTGRIRGLGISERVLEPTKSLGAVRSWDLPAGSYDLELRFETPFLRMGAYVSLFFLVIWVGASILVFRLGRLANRSK